MLKLIKCEFLKLKRKKFIPLVILSAFMFPIPLTYLMTTPSMMERYTDKDVSYTHLDVYKRQTQTRTARAEQRNAQAERRRQTLSLIHIFIFMWSMSLWWRNRFCGRNAARMKLSEER